MQLHMNVNLKAMNKGSNVILLSIPDFSLTNNLISFQVLNNFSVSITVNKNFLSSLK